MSTGYDCLRGLIEREMSTGYDYLRGRGREGGRGDLGKILLMIEPIIMEMRGLTYMSTLVFFSFYFGVLMFFKFWGEFRLCFQRL